MGRPRSRPYTPPAGCRLVTFSSAWRKRSVGFGRACGSFPLNSARRKHPPVAGAEADRHRARRRAAGAQRQLVAILEEAALLAIGERQRRLAALADLEQRAEPARLGDR